MIKTEEDASYVLCCGPLVAVGLKNCVGSGCMAWRWFDSVSDDGKSCHWQPTKMAMRHPDDTKDKPLDQRRGFCGLAGKP